MENASFWFYSSPSGFAKKLSGVLKWGASRRSDLDIFLGKSVSVSSPVSHQIVIFHLMLMIWTWDEGAVQTLEHCGNLKSKASARSSENAWRKAAMWRSVVVVVWCPRGKVIQNSCINKICGGTTLSGRWIWKYNFLNWPLYVCHQFNPLFRLRLLT